MNDSWLLLYAVPALPLLGMCGALIPLRVGLHLFISVAVTALECCCCGLLFPVVREQGRVFLMGNLFFVDMLSLFHLLLVAAIFFLASLYGYGYFRDEVDHGAVEKKQIGRLTLLWNGFLMSLIIVLMSNSIGILWVALESTTLASAFLIIFSGKKTAIEAMWKYLLICSIGIALAFVGVLLISVASSASEVVNHTLLWTELVASADRLNASLVKAAFIFALVGFGTKAGLAPMHTWLPDAHSQSPSPVSAVFSGVMLSVALYCILRYLPLVELSSPGEGRQLLRYFGLFSMGIAAIFILSQRDFKRLLAYSSIEHIGIVSLGFGIGGLGAAAALLHTLNHAFAKSLAFFSAGKLAQMSQGADIDLMRGSFKKSPLWSAALFASVLTLVGAAPFGMFISELQLCLAALRSSNIVALVLFLLFCSIIFICMLRHCLNVCCGTPSPELEKHKNRRWFFDFGIVFVMVAILLALGIWVPAPLHDVFTSIQMILEGRL